MERKKEKNPHAVALGRKGGKARIQKMTAEQRREIARKAVQARWAKHKKHFSETGQVSKPCSNPSGANE